MHPSSPPRNAPGPLGAFALLLVALLPACERNREVAEWEGETVAEETAAHEAAEAAAEAEPSPAAQDRPARDTGAPDEGSLRFVAYNVENWLTMSRYVDRKPAGETSKPDKEKAAVVSMLAGVRPDAVGLCEIGSEADLADLQQRLKAAGIDLPHAYHTGGSDDTRHLAFLSRFPFATTTPHPDLDYNLEGKPFSMSRGILDVTLQAPQGEIRFLGAHLKSKREIPEADQEMMRRAEAHLLRRAADRIYADEPDVRLVVYGDMNDTRQASAIRTIQGPREGPKGLKMAYLRDSRDETWTHHWSYQDVYSRFDYVFLSPNLLDGILWDACRVLDPDDWADASDHRALLMVFN